MPSKDPTQRFEDILENITLRVDPNRVWLMIEDDLSVLKAGAQRALDLLRQTEQ